ncbi:MAG TPA: helix-turn-helix transcriptional regulator, partial [Candidatus Avimonas sp.]|nr:helix-turn-helix transcriptional regulator [Candidatus Avimonas sp.]
MTLDIDTQNVYNVAVIHKVHIGGEKMYPNIKAERARNGMTVEELAKKLGVTRKTYYNWCAKGRIPQDKLIAMADLFG